MLSCVHIQGPAAGGLAAAGVSSTVYKDDCMFCYDTPLAPRGLAVCLTCFQGFCRGDLDHSATHAARTGHSLYLTIKKVPKEVEDRPEDSGRLVVRTLGDADLYATTLGLYCTQCAIGSSVEAALEPLQTLVSAVVSASSANDAADATAWEQQVVACAHSRALVPASPSVATAPAACQECSLGENLWVCLSCGYVGCGRAQYGGIPGNSHALSHHELLGHAVACKLGLLLATLADCYCYSCNDEVAVDLLDLLLAAVGVNRALHHKTERTLVELQIDQNKRFEFSMNATDGSALAPVYGPGFTGMQNLGNLCYLLLVVQAVFQLTPFQHAFTRELTEADIAAPAASVPNQWAKLADGLTSGRYAQPDSVGIRPVLFKAAITANHAEFASGRQQDAYEFWQFLMAGLDTYFLGALPAVPEEIPTMATRFLVGTRVSCLVCLHTTHATLLVDSLLLPLKDSAPVVDPSGNSVHVPVSVELCFAQLCAPERIEGYACDHCGKATTAVKRVGLRLYPQVLVGAVQRIRLGADWQPVKLEVPIIANTALDLQPYAASTEFPDEESGEGAGEGAGAGASAPAFVPSPEALLQLEMMGFPHNQCARALQATGNGLAEAAMEWLFEHTNDPDINDPLDVAAAPAAPASAIPQEALEALMGMGFSAAVSTKALTLTSNDVQAAVEWVFAHPDDDGSMEAVGGSAVSVKEVEARVRSRLLREGLSTPSRYGLRAVICHKGLLPMTGHYVVYVRAGERWVLFNDDKVVEAEDAEVLREMRKTSYVFAWEQLSSLA